MIRKLSRCLWMVPVAFGAFVFAADDATMTPPAANAPAGAMPMQSMEQMSLRRLSKLMGAAVFSSDTQPVGSIKDIVFDGTRHQAGYIIVSCDKVPGMTDKLAAIPYQTLQSGSGDEVRLTVDRKTISSGPTFARAQWPSEVTASTYSTADDYYRKEAKADTGMMTAQPAAAQTGKEMAWTQRASDLVGKSVQTPKGEGIGDLKDIVLDPKTGNTLYGVLSFGGMIGVGDKYFAVPIDNFKAEPGSTNLVLDADKEQLKKASGFDKEHWPSRPSEPWLQ